MRMKFVILSAFLLVLFSLQTSAPNNGEQGLQLVHCVFTRDAEFPELMTYIKDGWDLKHGMAPPKPYRDIFPLGATIRAYVKNRSSDAAGLDDITLNGINLADHIRPLHREHSGLRAASFLLNDPETTSEQTKKRLEEMGSPIWHRVRPNPVPPGKFAEIVIRLRRIPDVKILNLSFGHSGVPAFQVQTGSDPELVITGINFSRKIDRVYLYVSQPDGLDFEMKSIELDGETATPEGGLKSTHGFLPLEIPLEQSWEYGSFHFISVETAQGLRDAALVRARDDFFALGMWGYRNHGNTDAERARDTCRAFRDHLFNTHMGMAGGQTGYLQKEEGLALLEEMGLRLMDRDAEKANVKHPRIYARFLLDEPDAHEHAVEKLPGHLRLGSYAQAIVGRQEKWTGIDPRNLSLLNVNLTYKPENWMVYGQLPDILAVDPYYQMRLKDVYWKHPGWLAKYCHPFYVFAISETAGWACRPRPLHVILNAVSFRKKNRVFRYATPGEKRIEFYYALAAGAKGISYWWFTPYGNCRGCGSSDPEAKALMREMAVLNAEARSLEPLFAHSSPAARPGSRFDPFTTCLPYWLMARTLFAGPGAAAIILVNRDHASDRAGTYYQEIPRAKIDFLVPRGMKDPKVFRFASGKMAPVDNRREGDILKMEIQKIALTEILIVTDDPSIPERVRSRWEKVSPMLKDKE